MSIVKTEHFARTRKTLAQLTQHMYKPELHRQVTERVPESRLGHELTRLCQTGLGEALDASCIAQAKLELLDLLDTIRVSLKRNRQGLDIQSPIILHCFPHWLERPTTRVFCLLPVHFQKAKIVMKSMGRLLIKLPAVPAVPKEDAEENVTSVYSQPMADVRSKDGLHMSPRKLNVALTKAAHSAMRKYGLAREQVWVSGSGRTLGVTVRLDCGWCAELVPCVVVPGVGQDDRYYVARRFHGESEEKGDVTWRPCSAIRDQDILHSICSTDTGLRLRAMHVLCRLLSRDWRLQPFTCFHVQSTLLHDVDFHVDHTPRWQRCTLEFCLRSLLKTLLYFVDRGNLPHFHLNPLNLWQDMTSRQLTLARNALSRVLTNENALVSLIRRTCCESCVSVDCALDVI